MTGVILQSHIREREQASKTCVEGVGHEGGVVRELLLPPEHALDHLVSSACVSVRVCECVSV
jgi:hypothetical protein